MHRMKILVAATVIAGLSISSANSSPAQPQAEPHTVAPLRYEESDGPLRVEVIDVSPKFLDFWAAAKDEPDPDKRFAIWKEKYGIAAVPPGPQGQEIARKLLDAAWDRYPAALDTIRAGARAMRPDPLTTLREVAAVLKPDKPLTVKVVTYVGGFEGNAYTYSQAGLPVVNIPLEMSPADRARVFPHEMTHAVHMSIDHLSGGWERTIGTTAFQEGLAIEVARAVNGGGDIRPFIEMSPGWYAKVEARRRAILQGILPYLDSKDSQTVFRFTMGNGTTGINREAYFVGYLVMEQLHGSGMTWAQIARIPEDRMPDVVRGAIEKILAEKSN